VRPGDVTAQGASEIVLLWGGFFGCPEGDLNPHAR
jgi:hypothetical protein